MFGFPAVTQEQYEEEIRQLNNGQPCRSLSDWPVPGILSHVAGPTLDGWYVVEVWESEESFQRFGELLAPIMEKAGIPPVAPKVYPVHNFVAQ
jgi:hypothetical protein